jgi:hypothetical protein
MDGVFMLGCAVALGVVGSVVIAMILYPILDVDFDPLRVKFKMRARRPSVRRRHGNKKPPH